MYRRSTRYHTLTEFESRHLAKLRKLTEQDEEVRFDFNVQIHLHRQTTFRMRAWPSRMMMMNQRLHHDVAHPHSTGKCYKVEHGV